MKRYEKMSKEEIIELYNSTEGCRSCKVQFCCNNHAYSCVKIANDYLNEEIKMIPRAWTFKTSEEVIDAWEKEKEALNCTTVSCSNCKYHTGKYGCKMTWLYEEVEVNE